MQPLLCISSRFRTVQALQGSDEGIPLPHPWPTLDITGHSKALGVYHVAITLPYYAIFCSNLRSDAE